MRKLSPILFLLLFNVLGYSQTFFQSGKLSSNHAFRPVYEQQPDWSYSESGLQMITSEHHNAFGTTLIQSSKLWDGTTGYSDTLQFQRWQDTNPLSQYYTYLDYKPSRILAAGLSHATVLPIKPVISLAQDFYVFDDTSWTIENPVFLNWTISPEGIEYLDFNPKYVAYAKGEEDEYHSFKIFGAFNNLDSSTLEIHEINTLNWTDPPTKLLQIELDHPVYLNNLRKSENHLIINGFELNESSGFKKRPIQLIVGLEDLILTEMEYLPSSENREVVDAIQHGGDIISIVATTDEFEERLISQLFVNGIEKTVFGNHFDPQAIIEVKNNEMLIGGDYNYWGTRKATVMGINIESFQKRIVGYADLGESESSFHSLHVSDYGSFIAGTTLDSNEPKMISFLTEMLTDAVLNLSDQQTEIAPFISSNLLHHSMDAPVYFEVRDIVGRAAYSGQTSNPTFDLSTLIPGIYVATISSKNEQTTIKIYVE